MFKNTYYSELDWSTVTVASYFPETENLDISSLVKPADSECSNEVLTTNHICNHIVSLNKTVQNLTLYIVKFILFFISFMNSIDLPN